MLLYCSAYYVVSNRFFKKDVNFLPVFFSDFFPHYVCHFSIKFDFVAPLLIHDAFF